MPAVSTKKVGKRKPPRQNQKLPREDFLAAIRHAKSRATDTVVQHENTSSLRHIRAALAENPEYETFSINHWQRLARWLIALLLLPLCIISSHTLFTILSAVSLTTGFWYSPEFWLFATGGILMAGWFFSRLQQRIFLYLYVLGHEYTHAIFAMLHLGRIAELKANADGGYIATNKNNLLISLSPYFFPFWSVMLIGLYGLLTLVIDLPDKSLHVLYLLTGATWTFHILWTIWMIPRDQPDLRDNDTFFSLVVIYLANVLLLALLLCLAVDSLSLPIFADTWGKNAFQFWHTSLRLAHNHLPF